MSSFDASAEAAAVAPFGSWESPITAGMVAEQGGGISDVTVEGSAIYWAEGRPKEGGRNALLRWSGGETRDVIPPGVNARTMVHEYGGGNFVPSEGTVFYSNFQDQRLYRLDAGAAPKPITPEGKMRYADCAVDRRRERLVCVREDHSGEGEAKNALVSIPMNGDDGIGILFGDSDFVAAPVIDAAGERLAWISWDHPHMPWDETVLWTAEITDSGEITNRTAVARGASVLEPRWGADGKLYFASDRSGWWNLYLHDAKGTRAIHATQADLSRPAWIFNQSSYAILDDGTIIAVAIEKARSRLVRIDPENGSLQAIETPFVDIREVRALDGQAVVFVGATETEPARLVRLDVSSGETTIIRALAKNELSSDLISIARPLEIEVGADEVTHAFYYPPRSPKYRGPEGAAPPLVVMAHGGPTAHVSPAFSLAHQFWTSRGFAVLDVNYRGSSGYGRAYRNKLRGTWGVIDIEDVVKAAQYAADQGLADPDRLIIRGGSAGGFVVLAAHAFYDVFATGANYYGVSDLNALARDTHKFEARYLDGLVGAYPERKDIYDARSPINHLDGFTRPLIILQGLDDKVVPPAQSDMIADALRKKGIRVEYLTFAGEGHGFRQKDNRIRSLEAELAFYRETLDLR